MRLRHWLALVPCAASQSFVPFDSTPYDSSLELIEAYSQWHNATLYAADIPCGDKKSVVYNSLAGVGDAVSGLVARLESAVKTGRLFFLGSISKVHWSVGMKNAYFEWDWRDAADKGLICPTAEEMDLGYRLKGHHVVDSEGAPIPEPALPVVFVAYGHATKSTSLRPYRQTRSGYVGLENVQAKLILPSPEVQKRLDAHALDMSRTHLVALAIRTGETDYMRFLAEGDENRFIQCFDGWRESVHGERAQGKQLVVHLTTDSDKVQAKIRPALDARGVRVLYNEGSVTHTQDAYKPNPAGDRATHQSTVKAFADFFLLGMADTAFLTYWSLFGGTATSLGGTSEVYKIGSSACGQPQHSMCADPLYPPFCDGPGQSGVRNGEL